MSAESPLPLETLSDTVWRALSEHHRRRAERWTIPVRRRHSRGVAHPIEDFLFSYYPFTCRKLEIWHPGFGTALETGEVEESAFQRSPYRKVETLVFADPAELSTKGRARLVWIRELLDQTQRRKPVFSCHGMHEWAMVYRGRNVRHQASTPLRLSQREIDHVVESRPIGCTHFDAFRFFHVEAQKFNRIEPTMDTRPELEQPGCVHANMDLYKWASKAMPWVGSDLLIDCFELAVRLRTLDMRASPYDLSEYGLEAIPIETPEGRNHYESVQRKLSAKTYPLREKLIGCLDQVLSYTVPAPGSCHVTAGGLRPRS